MKTSEQLQYKCNDRENYMQLQMLTVYIVTGILDNSIIIGNTSNRKPGNLNNNYNKAEFFNIVQSKRY